MPDEELVPPYVTEEEEEGGGGGGGGGGFKSTNLKQTFIKYIQMIDFISGN
jgi:hypothetical protein